MFQSFFNKIYKQHLGGGEEVLLVFAGNIALFLKSNRSIILWGLITPLVLSVIIFPKFIWFFVVWFVLASLRFLYLYYIWARDVWLLTTLGMVKVQWSGPYRLSTSRIEFPDIAEIGVDKQGIYQHFHGIGTIQIVLNNGNVIEFKNQKNPEGKVKLLSDIRLEFMRNAKWGDEDTLKDLLSQMVGRFMKEDRGVPFQKQKTKYDDDIVIEVIQKERWDFDQK